MLNAMLLLNGEQVSTAIRGAFDKIAKGTRHRNKRIALYAEREFQQYPSACLIVPENFVGALLGDQALRL